MRLAGVNVIKTCQMAGTDVAISAMLQKTFKLEALYPADIQLTINREL